MREWMAGLTASFIAFVSVDTASAIPAFARRYKVECHMCHQGFPKLNKTGQRFKERGFRLENEDPFKVEDWVNSIPVRVRATGAKYFFEGGSSFNYAYLKVISAGNLGSRLSYWADDAFLFDDDDSNDVHQKPDNVWVRAEALKGGKLYVKAGRMELDLPFTQARKAPLFSYEIYGVNTGAEHDSFAERQDAVEVGGSLGDDSIHWSAAVASGAEDKAGEALTDAAGDFEGNLFLRVAHRGERNRLGAFSYIGRNTLATARAGGPLTWEDKLLRVGGDADLWFSKLNLYGLYMYGRNSDSASGGGGVAANFNGGFAEADYHAVEKERPGFLKEIALQLTLRGNLNNQPSGGLTTHKTFSSVYPGARLFIRERLRLSFEYGFRGQARPDQGAVTADLVF
jgi:hypothetical protein